MSKRKPLDESHLGDLTSIVDGPTPAGQPAAGGDAVAETAALLAPPAPREKPTGAFGSGHPCRQTKGCLGNVREYARHQRKRYLVCDTCQKTDLAVAP